jgi:hypothetical protein
MTDVDLLRYAGRLAAATEALLTSTVVDSHQQLRALRAARDAYNSAVCEATAERQHAEWKEGAGKEIVPLFDPCDEA